MGSKRPHHDDPMPEPMSPRNPSRPFKRRKSNDFAPPATKPASVNQLKSRIRDLTRALEHSDHLPAGVRIEKERALAGYKQDVEKIRDDKRKSELIKKYHMVRFFERQKATRALKKLQRRLDETAQDSSGYNQLATEVQDAKIDLNYTIYHPLTEKYKSLFPRQGVTGGEQAPARKLVTEKPAMWKVVEQCTADGTLESLREGKLTTRNTPAGESNTVPERTRSRRETKNGRTETKPSENAAPQDQHEGSDGGFFEE